MPLTTVSQGLLSTDAQYTGFKNRIINGQMTIDQRNAGASQSVSANTYPYTVDRFWIACGASSAGFTVQQNQGAVTPPTGFSNYVGITVATSKSPASGDEFTYEQPIEGNNVADLGFGTAGASTVTFSFWVRSSLTGTFSGYLLNGAQNRSYIFNYTISAANTWEQKAVTIAGDTSGTWLKTTGVGARIGFDLGSGSNYQTTANTWSSAGARRTSGSVQLIANSGATFYITGVQLEKGSTATSFDYRPYGTEMQLCERYFVKSFGTYTPVANGWSTGSTTSDVQYVYRQSMRSAPTVVFSNMVITDGVNYNLGITSFTTYNSAYSTRFFLTHQSGATSFRPCCVNSADANGFTSFSAEL